MNLPNKLSLIRIFLIPLLVVVLLTRWNDAIALTVFILAAITDWLDGYIARNSQQITTLGKFLDPIADKLLISAAFISLVEIQRIPAWIVVVIVGRELVITGMRSIAAAQQNIIPASRLGKYKVGFETAAIIILILNLPYKLGIISAWMAMIMAVISGIDHLIKFKKGTNLEW
ncbi:CDP-diacylglycerol--glycerol-3-phosphate 3-phosphatidyltransferase [bacterium]|nr:CDP-diacylglycerol--glycerol-3-phosphate 3-phosphatidyltransferase [bacterium]